MKKFKQVLTIMAIVALFIMSSCEEKPQNPEVCLHDNATFGGFSDEKTEKFEIVEETDVAFTFTGNIEKGDILVKITDENDGVIFENSELEYNHEFTVSLDVGVYTYLLILDECKNGAIYHYAEPVE